MAEQSWHDVIGDIKEQAYFKHALDYYDAACAAGKTVFPPREDLFNAFKLTPFNKLKVIIIGQDPYHGPHQAMGLSFSVHRGEAIPPSLRNIFKELSTDIPGFTIPRHGDLSSWATQGVLLLNAILSVEMSKPLSHAKQGWEDFTSAVISRINETSEHNVYLLWGSYAKQKCANVDRSRNLVLESVHPSPLSAKNGFFGCQHFSKANEYLIAQGKEPIDWCLPD